MTQIEKELLLKDLCARLPYGVKVKYSSYKGFVTCTLQSINPVYDHIDLWSKNACFNPVSISKIKPYLFPLSSMTDEQKKDYQYVTERWMHDSSYSYSISDNTDWLNKNHFDYRGLIKKGLAIDATGLNIY